MIIITVDVSSIFFCEYHSQSVKAPPPIGPVVTRSLGDIGIKKKKENKTNQVVLKMKFCYWDAMLLLL